MSVSCFYVVGMENNVTDMVMLPLDETHKSKSKRNRKIFFYLLIFFLDVKGKREANNDDDMMCVAAAYS